MSVGKYDNSLKCLEEAFGIRKEKFGLDHRDTATTLNNLGLVNMRKGEIDLAKSYLDKAYSIRSWKLFQDQYPDIGQSYNDVGILFDSVGNLGEARANLEKAARVRTNTLLENHPLIAETLTNLAKVCLAQGDNATARNHYEKSLNIYRLRYGDDHSQTSPISARGA